MDNATAEEFNAQPIEVRYNCAMDYGAKCELWDLDPEYPPDQPPFPLEPICMFVREEKMTSDTASHIRFHAHRELAKAFFKESGIRSAGFESNSKKWIGITVMKPLK